MDKTIVSQAIDSMANPATQSGSLFAQSESNAQQAFEVFARSIGDAPTFDTFEQARIDWVNGYVATKPNSKGNSADSAFKRFRARLVEAYATTLPSGKPKSESESATKKRLEREKKQANLMAKHAQATPTFLRAQLEQAYKTLAQDPESAIGNALVKEIKTVLKAKTKGETEAEKAELKAIRDKLIGLVRSCVDMERLETAIDLLDPDNELLIS